MSTIEESQIHSETINLQSSNPMSEPAVKKIRRGRPKSKDESQAAIETEKTIASASLNHARVPSTKTVIIPSAPKVRNNSDNKEEKVAGEVFSFSPNDEVPTSSKEKDHQQEQSQPEEEKTIEKPKFFKKPDFHNKQHRPAHHHQHPHRHPQHQQRQNQQPQKQQNLSNKPQHQAQKPKSERSKGGPSLDLGGLLLGNLPNYELFRNKDELERLATEISTNEMKLNFNELYAMTLQELAAKIKELGIEHEHIPHRRTLLTQALNWAKEQHCAIIIKGIVEKLENGGLVVYSDNNYSIKELSAFIPASMMKEYGLMRGHEIEIQAHPPREGETCPFALRILKVMDDKPDEVAKKVPFEDLIPYYPTTRLFLETKPDVTWDNFSMRLVDILTPVGLGQRGLIVAPPRTGKTMLLQGIAHAITMNRPDVHLIVLLIDERPEEVTDFKRQVTGEVISSTFDESAISHVHAAEMVIEKARRLVEYGKHVVILLDSITRLARAYNTLMPSSGKILSGGIEANSLQKPKRFFGSARNIEHGGSLTILGTALIDTGSRMDEVIFEEFKGTGNMELHLDRELVAKRIFPAISIEKSGTRKEELIYHPDEEEKVITLRRAMKGIPPVEAVEMLIQRIRKTKSNTEFYLGLNR